MTARKDFDDFIDHNFKNLMFTFRGVNGSEIRGLDHMYDVLGENVRRLLSK